MALGLLTTQLKFNVAISICVHESACQIPKLERECEYEHNIGNSAVRDKGDAVAVLVLGHRGRESGRDGAKVGERMQLWSASV